MKNYPGCRDCAHFRASNDMCGLTKGYTEAQRALSTFLVWNGKRRICGREGVKFKPKSNKD